MQTFVMTLTVTVEDSKDPWLVAEKVFDFLCEYDGDVDVTVGRSATTTGAFSYDDWEVPGVTTRPGEMEKLSPEFQRAYARKWAENRQESKKD